ENNMKIICLFGLRSCRYPGEYAPELLDAIDEIGDDDNPSFLNDREDKCQKSGEFAILKRIDINLSDEQFDLIFYKKSTINGSIVKPKNTEVPELYIGVQYDVNNGWIVEVPKIYEDGIGYEVESKWELYSDALEDAERFSENTGLPIRKRNKQGKEIVDLVA
ncbi:MAG TPA: hypothetical protein VMV43_00935, partial [Candidatus Nanopelagicaceae bacterium]|nr:hypothetical protein [Candidatus Nanopelagicaceae bacterium]